MDSQEGKILHHLAIVAENDIGLEDMCLDEDRAILSQLHKALANDGVIDGREARPIIIRMCRRYVRSEQSLHLSQEIRASLGTLRGEWGTDVPAPDGQLVMSMAG